MHHDTLFFLFLLGGLRDRRGQRSFEYLVVMLAGYDMPAAKYSEFFTSPFPSPDISARHRGFSVLTI